MAELGGSIYSSAPSSAFPALLWRLLVDAILTTTTIPVRLSPYLLFFFFFLESALFGDQLCTAIYSKKCWVAGDCQDQLYLTR